MKFIMFFIIFYAKLHYHLTLHGSLFSWFSQIFICWSQQDFDAIRFLLLIKVCRMDVPRTYIFYTLAPYAKMLIFSWFVYFHISQTNLTNGKVNGDFLETIILTNSKFWKKKVFEGQYFRILSLSIIVLKCAIDSTCSRPKSFFVRTTLSVQHYNTVCSTLQHYIFFSS